MGWERNAHTRQYGRHWYALTDLRHHGGCRCMGTIHHQPPCWSDCQLWCHVIYMTQHSHRVNSLRPSDAYMRRQSSHHYTPRNEVRGGILDSPCSSVRPSVRPSVGRCPDDNSNSFQWIYIFFFTYITWVKILHGIEYQRPTSLNMRILADHVTYSFLAFPKSIF